MTKSKQHTLFVPIYGLELGKEVKRELKVGRVTFISSEKIPLVRKRLGLRDPVSVYKSKLQHDQWGMFNQSATYATLKTRLADSRSPIDKELSEIQTSFWLLASSFTFWKLRSRASLSLREPPNSKTIRDIWVFDSGSGKFRTNYTFNAARRPNRCEGYWRMHSRDGHFGNLQKILVGELNVSKKWKESITKASVLYGQSILAKSLPHAFLCNMIAIETLLTGRGDKFPESLIERMVALFGWWTDEDPAPWRETLTRLYRLRCGYVHDGTELDLDVFDLRETDTFLHNLLTNICAHTKTIKSKQDIVEMAEISTARRRLGIRPKRKERYLWWSRTMTKDEQKQLKADLRKWTW